MPSKFNISFYARIASFAVLFYIPCLYIPILMPAFFLSLASVLSIAAGVAFSKLKVRTSVSILVDFCALMSALVILFLLIGTAHTPKFDDLLLHFGQAFWLILATMLFSSLTTILLIRTEKWKFIEPLLLIFLLCALFWSQGHHSLTLMNHPIKAASFALCFMVLQVIELATFERRHIRKLIPLLFFIPFFIAGTFFLIRTYNARSVSNNGGLIQPTLFRFDFSPFLSLQNEIKMNNNLIMIVRTKEENTATFLRRIYLSGWNPRKGFYEAAAPGEKAQQKEVPRQKTTLPHSDFSLRTPVDQEYFVVNFDPSSLIAMDYPVEVTPYKIWNSTSFSGAYSVTSDSTGFMPFELFDSNAPSGRVEEGMSAEALSFYTTIDAHYRTRLEPLAKGITKNIPGYYDKILALVTFLHDGDFRYSLKPGTAPDGDQLSWFLFSTKKGYCTYFAFSLCLMLRSVGIPSRVAAGFFIQPDSGALDYYPIRANMAHAWVEVFFPKYGWISFDPTTTKIADGEDLSFSNAPGGDEFMNLLNEIIDNRVSLTAGGNNAKTAEKINPLGQFLKTATKIISQNWCFLLVVFSLIAGCVLAVVWRRKKNRELSPRKRILEAARKMYRTFSLAGKKRHKSLTRKQYIHSLDDSTAEDLFTLEQKARFALICSAEDAQRAETLSASLRKTHRPKFPFFLVLCAFCLCINSGLQAESPKKEAPVAELLSRAQRAILAENWENAITILSEGIVRYPLEPEFRKNLGTLYLNQGLYESAYKELKEALAMGYSNTDIYSNLSDAASYLNYDEEALGFLKQYLDAKPEDLFAWSNYGWLCYKTHRIGEGIMALKHVAETNHPDGNLYVGLANLYTAAFDYINAKKYYTLAINIAIERHQPYLSSIYYYNRSILEEVFYNFSDAYDDTKLSLEQSPRSSGYLMQGELELRKLEFKTAFQHYLKAYSLDSTPLAAIGLADTLLQSGHPVGAFQYIKAIQAKTDMSWIANYGTTTNQYLADFNKIQKDYYKFKRNAEKRTVVHNLSTFISSLKNQFIYSVCYWYHDTIFRIKNTQVAKHYSAANSLSPKLNGQKLFINSYYFLAFDKWKRTAIPYLTKADEIETSYIPAATPSYLYERGKLLHDIHAINDSISSLNPIWEREYLAKALAERIALLHNTNKAQTLQDSIQLYYLSPAAFIYHDIKLPVSIEPDSANEKSSLPEFSHIKKMLAHAGFVQSKDSPLKIDVLIRQDLITVILVNRNNESTLYTQKIHKTNGYQQEIPGLINMFSTGVFSSDIGVPNTEIHGL